MFKHGRWVWAAVAVVALSVSALGMPGAALAQVPKIKDQPLHKKFELPTPTIPDYTYGPAYTIAGLPAQYVTVTLADGRSYIIPAPPYDSTMAWGSFASYDDWYMQFRSQNRGHKPSPKDETDFWVSQAMAGLYQLTGVSGLPGSTAPLNDVPLQSPGPATLTVTTDSGQVLVIPRPPYDHAMPWGSFGTYDNWATQFRAQSGRNPTTQDEIDFWESQALSGLPTTP